MDLGNQLHTKINGKFSGLHKMWLYESESYADANNEIGRGGRKLK